MNSKSRTIKSVINVLSMIVNKMLGQLMGFVVRTVFIYTISIEYMGVSSLFASILGILSLAELGIGGAMTYLLYKPMAEHDEETIVLYLRLYKRIYRIVGIFILIAGIALTPFLDFFIAEAPDIEHLRLIYILYVVNTAITYLVGAYRQALFQADQKLYKINNYTTIISVIFSIIQIGVLLLFRNFIFYVCMGIVQNIVLNLILLYAAQKEYPFICKKVDGHIPKEGVEHIKKTVKGVFLYKLSASVLNGTDSILVSKFVSITAVAQYTNYYTVITIIRTFLYMCFDGIVPSLGNLCVGNVISKKREVFKELQFINEWLAGVAAVCLAVLLNPFIKLWAGSQYVMPESTTLILVLVFYIQSSLKATGTIRDAAGLFYESRWLNVAQCIVNLLVSVILAMKFSLPGIFLGTIVALMTTMFWIQPYLVYKYILEETTGALMKYYCRQLLHMLEWSLVYVLIRGIIEIFHIDNFIIMLFITGISANLFAFITKGRSKEFKNLYKRIVGVVKRKS